MKKIIAAVLIAISAATLSGCEDPAKTASRNVSKAADNFEVDRRILFYNGITNEILLEIRGRCSIGSGQSSESITVICKDANDSFKKHQLGLSDNVTYISEQLEYVKADAYRSRVTIKPEAVIPDLRLETSGKESK